MANKSEVLSDPEQKPESVESTPVEIDTTKNLGVTATKERNPYARGPFTEL